MTSSEKPLTANIDPRREPLSLREYEQRGGYRALRTALLSLDPPQVTHLVLDAGLRGCGGAGFPTGKKWNHMALGKDTRHPKYLVVNADEMEPGTFKDRFLLEGDPHQMIEAAIVSGYAIQADVAYIFLRWAYKRAAQYLIKAIAEAYNKGYLGKNILGSGYSLDIYLHTSAGRYICGESSAMLSAIEGKRALPRKDSHATASGLWGKPTVVNNVETLCNVPHIVNNGVSWYKGLSITKGGGTKIYGVSGKVQRPGAWELPMGTTMREILEEHAGGMRAGLTFRALLPGGASTAFVLEEGLDVSMDFDSLQALGSRMGTGTMIILDDKTCPVDMLVSLQRFFAQESCGWCTPCREGLPWIAKMLGAIDEGAGKTEDLEELTLHTRFLGSGYTYCALAPGATESLESGLKYFKADFERHVRDKHCPWRA
ncbi:complex I 51 kDa subunit family protein [Acidiferrobacter thiooxydans]